MTTSTTVFRAEIVLIQFVKAKKAAKNDDMMMTW
jgi:hypothetical protein